MNARILVIPAGSIGAQAIIKSLKLANKTSDDEYMKIAADMSQSEAGLCHCDSGVLVPP